MTVAVNNRKLNEFCMKTWPLNNTNETKIQKLRNSNDNTIPLTTGRKNIKEIKKKKIAYQGSFEASKKDIQLI